MDGSSLTILFEAPFWVGIYQRTGGGTCQVCRIVFGGEPKDYEVYEFLLKNWKKLQFSPPVPVECAAERKINPKRMRREISSRLQDRGIGTKAQQALQPQREQAGLERKERRHRAREEERDRRYALRQEKKKQKHRGK